MSGPRVLVAGIGNIFLGDDAFGVEVARRLLERPLPDGVDVADFGIRGFDLAYALMDGYDAAVLVDALACGGPPGTLYVLEPDPAEWDVAEQAIQTHGLDPLTVLRLVRTLGGTCPTLRVLGCEPATFGTEEEPVVGLSAPVQAAVAEAVGLAEALARSLRDGAAQEQTRVRTA
jgi:hydrogenase maturation protease